MEALAPEVFDGVDVAMFDVPDEVSAEWAPIAAAHGAVAVTTPVRFAWTMTCPWWCRGPTRSRPKSTRGIISNPNCTTLSMIVVMGALHREFGLESLVVASYQATSGAGQAGIDTLRDQIQAVAGTGSASAPATCARSSPSSDRSLPA